MKLHLPINLFRAVMALFTAHTLITATWADETPPIDTESTVKTLELEADTEYSAWEGVLFPNEWGTDHHIITTKEGSAPVSVSFSNASNSALHEEQITLKNLKDITFNNIVLEDVEFAIGGAMDSYALGNSVVTIENNANVAFTGNKATVTVGGSAEGAVVRADNIYLRDNESITMTDNVSSTIDGDCIGGAMSSGGGDFELSGTKGNIDISKNSAISGSNHRVLGGAILAVDMVEQGNFGGTITISRNSGDTISITGNTVETGESAPNHGNNEPSIYITVGGALLAMQNVEISNNKASLIDISANKATAKGSNDAYGGAIASFSGVTITHNQAATTLSAEANNRHGIVFEGNSVSSVTGSAYGGAIAASNQEFSKFGLDQETANQRLPNFVTMSNNGDITFSGNSAKAGMVDDAGNIISYAYGSAYGGAIYSYDKVTLSENANVTFTDNSVSAVARDVYGGAIYGVNSITISGNGAVVFDSNHALSLQVEHENGGNIYYSYGYAYGGAIASEREVIIQGNTNGISFTDNQAHSEHGAAYGGAIISRDNVTIQNNTNGISFTGNKVIAGVVDENGNIQGSGGSACGGAIYSNDTVNIIGNSGDITFNNNEAISAGSYADGAAIYANNSVSIKNNTGDITFNNNLLKSKHYVDGCAIHSNDTVEIIGIGQTNGTPGNLTFTGNTITVTDSSGRGASIFAAHGIELSHNGDILFQNNSIDAQKGTARGAGISTNSSEPTEPVGIAVAIRSNGNVTFDNNDVFAYISSSHGGAIHSYYGAVDISGNKDVIFTNNDAISRDNCETGGGAIYSEFGASFSKNQNIEISYNSAISHGGNAYGGAINTDRGDISFTENQSITISNNTISGIGSYMKVVDVENENGEVINSYEERALSQITAGGGLASNRNVELSKNKGDIIFSQNTVIETKTDEILPSDGYDGSDENPYLPQMAGAGAIGAGQSLIITENTGNISFSENTASSECKGVYGGAIATIAGYVNISNNHAGESPAGALTLEDGTILQKGSVNFSQNSISSTANTSVYGGAIATYTNAYGGGQVLINNNDSVSFYYNSSTTNEAKAYGGAIYAENTVQLQENGSVSFFGNSATSDNGTALGGAIYAKSGLSIVNNSGDVTFSGNYVNNGGTYQLNSVYVEGGKVELAAAAGKSISFYDSVLINTGSDIVLNGNGQTSTGDIIFSGARTAEDLAAAKGEGSTVTDAEIMNSRTSIIASNVSVAAGSLQVKDAAELHIDGTLAVNDGAKLSIGAGSTVATGDGLTFSASAKYATTAAIAHAGTFSMKEATTTAAAEIMGNVTLTAGMTYTMDGAFTELVGKEDTLTLAASGTAHYKFNLDESLAYTQGDSKYFVLFTGAEDFKLSGVNALGDVLFDTNLTLTDAVLGYDKESGTLYVSASKNIPEPATATLSLLALAALAARRRRR